MPRSARVTILPIGAAADAARSKSEGAIKPVVQFHPLARLDQLRDRQHRDRRGRAPQRPPDIGRAGFKELPGRHRALDFRHFLHGAIFPEPALLCKRWPRL